MNIKKMIYLVLASLFVISSIGMIDQTSLHANDSYYVWQDEFENAQKIDASFSSDFIIEDGTVKMYGTYDQWTNADWTRMKKISISSNEEIVDCVLKMIIEYDSDMRSDYGDIRFKFQSYEYWLPYWIEEINPEPNNPYAIVWIRIASLPQGDSEAYLFYGNPSAIDIGSYWSVFDENSWNKYYLHDHQVTFHGEREGAWDPDVVWGDNAFFVTWEEGVPYYPLFGMIFKQQIRGCFYSEDGIQLGDRFDITLWDTSPGSTFRCEDPSTAYGSSGSLKHYFVAYEEYSEPLNELSRNIKGAIVPSYTQSINDVTNFIICNANENQEDPCVAYDDDNNRFFVVWGDARQGTSNYNIYGRLYDLNGNPAGSEKIISNRPNSQCEPWITYDTINNHFMIVWEEGLDATYGPFEIWGQLFTTNGDPLGDAQRLSLQGQSTNDYNFPCVAYCPLKERYLVTWQGDDISSDVWYGPVYGKILDENCNTIVDIFEIDNGPNERTNIVPHLSSSFFVCYDKGGDIWGKLISSEGDVNPYDLQISDGDSDPADWANIGSSGEKIFVAWEDTRILYPLPYDDLNMPDIYANVWSFNTPSADDVSYDVWEEISLVSKSIVTSVVIDPENIDSWFEFNAIKQGNIRFDIVDAIDPNIILLSDISSGASIQSLNPLSIRLKATFSRNNPSSSPLLDSWQVSYVGEDKKDPVTTIDDIEGVKGLNEWYISEGVTIWLHAEDYPTDTGSGIDTIYYLKDNQGPFEYNRESGLQIQTTQESHWMGQWRIQFWSVDKAGNIEDKDKPENTIEIKIDASQPYIEITSPADEEQVNVPFWVKAEPSDNVGVDYVEFDIEPFGEREGLPYVDTEPPYEWYCDVQQIVSKDKGINDGGFATTGVNRMVRAKVYDESGQSWSQDVWVFIKNWKKSRDINCDAGFLLAFGSPSQSSQYASTTSDVTEEYPFAPSCLYYEEFNWNYASGISLIFTADGVVSKTGSQSGQISNFIGLSLFNHRIIAGFGSLITLT